MLLMFLLSFFMVSRHSCIEHSAHRIVFLLTFTNALEINNRIHVFAFFLSFPNIIIVMNNGQLTV